MNTVTQAEYNAALLDRRNYSMIGNYQNKIETIKILIREQANKMLDPNINTGERYKCEVEMKCLYAKSNELHKALSMFVRRKIRY